MDLRYPVGKFDFACAVAPEDRPRLIEEIAAAPTRIREAVHGLADPQLDTPYRDGGWTVRQVVHHLADSHMNSYIRFRLALTEQEPSVKAYDEKKWAELVDARTGPLEPSLQILENMHLRWVALLQSMSADDFARTFRHPQMGTLPLDRNLALYAWHGRHHVAQITGLRDRSSW
jgi:uncharacterized damage-inducible protein DinB